MPGPPYCSNSDKTPTSVPDSAITDLSDSDTVSGSARDSTRHPSNATEASVVDSAVNVNTPTDSGSNTPQTSYAVIQKTYMALGMAISDVVPQAGMREATSVGQPDCREHPSQIPTVESRIQSERLSRASSQGGSLTPMSKKSVRRVNNSANLRLDTNVSNFADGPSSIPALEDRSLYISTWDENLQRRVNVHDRRASSVREQLDRVAVSEFAGIVRTTEDIRDDSTVEEFSRFPIPSVLLAHEHSYMPHRPAPSPPKGAVEWKTVNPFKRLCAWARHLDQRWDARGARKEEAKDVKMAGRQEAKFDKWVVQRGAGEKQNMEQQRRRDSIARARDVKAKIKRDVDAHTERQRVLECKTKDDLVRQKREMVDRKKGAKLALKERKRLDTVDRKEANLRKRGVRKELKRRLWGKN